MLHHTPRGPEQLVYKYVGRMAYILCLGLWTSLIYISVMSITRPGIEPTRSAAFDSQPPRQTGRQK